MERIEKDYEEFLRLLKKHDVRYCIVGAYAVAYHAIARYTKDMDIFVEPEKENARRLVRAIEEFGFTGLTEKDFIIPGVIIQLGYEPVRIDIVTSIDGCTFEEVWNNRVIGRYGNTEVYFMGLEELIKNKKASGRKQDELDIDILMKKRAEEM